MHRFWRIIVSRLTLAGVCVLLAAGLSLAQKQASSGQVLVRQVKVLGGKDVVEIEVESSGRVTPETQVLSDPDRLVVDFPNAVPGRDLRSQSVDRGEVKDVRVGLFQSKPPVTRVVLDLKSAQSYQVFPGQTVIIKVMGEKVASNPPQGKDAEDGVDDFPAEQPTRPGLVVANYTAGRERVQVENSSKPLEVSFRDGLLAIRANKATLSEVLYAVQQRTGAEVSIAAGAEQERVVVDLGPAPASDVLAQLLNGSRFNFLILSAANDPRRLDKVILSPRTEGVVLPPPVAPSPAPVTTEADDEEPVQPAPPQTAPGQRPPVPAGGQPDIHPEVNPPTDDNRPQ